MKKLFTVLLLCAVTSVASAQDGGTFGIKGGLNIANMSNISGSEFKPGFYIGVYGESFLNDFFSIQPEIVYSTQGASLKDTQYESSLADIRILTDYLNISILGKYYFIDKASINLGVQCGILMSQKGKVEMNGRKFTQKYENLFKSADVSIVMGLSYKITRHIEASGRFNLGLTKVSEQFFWNSPGSQTLRKDTKNRVIQIGLGYSF